MNEVEKAEHQREKTRRFASFYGVPKIAPLTDSMLADSAGYLEKVSWEESRKFWDLYAKQYAYNKAANQTRDARGQFIQGVKMRLTNEVAKTLLNQIAGEKPKGKRVKAARVALETQIADAIAEIDWLQQRDRNRMEEVNRANARLADETIKSNKLGHRLEALLYSMTLLQKAVQEREAAIRSSGIPFAGIHIG